jgi:hypothetical protein
VSGWYLRSMADRDTHRGTYSITTRSVQALCGAEFEPPKCTTGAPIALTPAPADPDQILPAVPARIGRHRNHPCRGTSAAVTCTVPHLSVHFRSPVSRTWRINGLSRGGMALDCTDCGCCELGTFGRAGLIDVIGRDGARRTAICAAPVAAAHSGHGGMTRRPDHCADTSSVSSGIRDTSPVIMMAFTSIPFWRACRKT